MIDVVTPDDIEQAKRDQQDQLRAKRICETLERKYPGYLWMANVDSRNGIANFWTPTTSGMHGYTIKLSEWDSDDKIIIQGAGEILERYRLCRGRMREDQVMELERDLRGNAKGDLT